MEEVIHRLEAELDAELLLQDAAQVLAVEGGPAILGGGPGLDPLLEADQLRAADPRGPAGVPPLVQGVGAVLVVLLDPGLDRSDAALEGLGDGDGIQALGGEGDGLVAPPEPFG